MGLTIVINIFGSLRGNRRSNVVCSPTGRSMVGDDGHGGVAGSEIYN